jgi:DNA-binding Lrp family transcriptional regulator
MINTDEEVIEALKQSTSLRAAARMLGVSHPSLLRRKKTLIKRGLWDESYNHIVPEGYYVKGKSQYYNKDGVPAGVWVKSDTDKEKQAEMMREVVEGFKSEIPKYNKKDNPTRSNADLMNCYILTDFHLGMMCWGEETGGDDWDLSKGIDLLMRWIDHAVTHSPEAETGLLAQMGDFMHWDGLDAVTPASKHVLDADTRFQKVVRSAIVVLRYAIGRMLQKYQKVVIIQTGGNHDPASTIWMREFFIMHFENEPRVYVDPSADMYFAYEFGNTLTCFHHGHKRHGAKVAETFVTRFRDKFGRTKHAYGHTGHFHSDTLLEAVGMRIEQHRTLAPPDAYSAHAGYSSGRDGKVITYHREHGEVSRLTVSPEMLKQ